MHPTALPACAQKDLFDSPLEAAVRVRDHQFDASQAAIGQRSEEGLPAGVVL
jgi:hypothetical protein